MKKTYIAPTSTAVNLVVEGMMALSTDRNMDYSADETVTNEGNVLSNDRAWSSSNWTDED
jgi:hypothetical protein|uniref:hypothetical protein n=1 Tax=Alloprevotella sp. TaxID=1872471 RepID=UPI003FEE2231